MNEQIKELLTQAGFSFDENGELNTLASKRVEKFAELIVRECIERVRNQYIPVRDQTVEDKLNPFHPQLRLRTDHEKGMVECGINSVISLEELIQEQTDKWYKENILGVEE
jgi:hypothetical protein